MSTEPRLGVIFDMDGVLVDSYRAHLESWQRMAAEHGRWVTEDEFARHFGRTSREIIAGWQGGRLCDDAEVARLDERKEALFREILAAHFPVMPGAAELLEQLHAAGFGIGLGSSGPPENVAAVMRSLGKRHLFGAVITGADVTRGKPDPQVFLMAAERLGIPPVRCAVVEDAPPGIVAAKAAGMVAVGMVSTGRTRAVLAEADVLVDSLTELSPSRFRELILARQAAGETRSQCGSRVA